MTATLREGWNDDFCTGPTMRFEDALDRRDAHVWQADWPDKHGARPEWRKGAQGASERGDGAGLGLRILADQAVMVGEHRLDARGVRAQHHSANFPPERLP